MLNITNLTKFYYDEVLEPVFYEKTTKQIIFGVIILLIAYFLEYALPEILNYIRNHKNFFIIIILMIMIIICNIL